MKKAHRLLDTVAIGTLLAAWSILSGGSCGGEGVAFADRPVGLLCHLLAGDMPPVIRDGRPRFSWIVPAAFGDGRQTAYQILVASDPKLLAEGKADCWDSGRIESDRSVAVSYAGTPLAEDRSYWWTVRIWGDGATPGDWAKPQPFRVEKFADRTSRYTTTRHPLVESRVSPQRVAHKGPGHFFIDFGKAAFGTVVLTVALPTDAEKQVVLHLGEKAGPNDTVERRPGASVRYQAIPLTLQPGTHTYRVAIPADPKKAAIWTIPMPSQVGEVLPFRYCEVAGMPDGWRPEDMHQVRVHYPFDDRASSFESSDKALNAVWNLCKYSIKATSFCGVYVDGDRERKPYEADAYINQLGHYCTDREYTLARYTHEYLMLHPTWPTEWSMQSVLIAWEDYMHTGDAASLAEFYGDLKEKTLYRLARPDGLISTVEPPVPRSVLKAIHLNVPLQDIVDWPLGERDGHEMRPVNTVVNAFHYRSLVLMGSIAETLHRPEDAAFFHGRAKEVFRSFNEKLFDTKKGLYVDGEGSRHASLHANMFPLAFGLVPPEHRASVAAFAAGRGMACSVYGAQFLLDALYESEQADAALKLLTSRTERSWMHMLDVGSTITLEAWDNRFKPNQDWNHAWGAAPANIIPRRLMGIEPLQPGFRKVRIRPQPGSLERAAVTLPTIRGPITVDFTASPGRFTMNVQLPGNTSAEVHLPCGSHRASQVLLDGSPCVTRAAGQFVVLDSVGPGRHRFEVRLQ